MITDLTYKRIINSVLEYGETVDTRNSTVLRRTNFMETFYAMPLVTVRKTAWKTALREMEFFLKGGNNINDLHPSVKPWWEPWTTKKGDMPNSYGAELRSQVRVSDDQKAHVFDQLEYLVDGIKKHPYSRRNVISLWDTASMAAPETLITNCHGTVVQCFVSKTGRLSMTMYQRSGDFLLGVQHNWIQYWAFLMWLARETDLEVGSLTWIGGDVHIYMDHYETARKIARAEDRLLEVIPSLTIDKTKGDFKADDFFMLGEVPDPQVTDKIPMII